MSNKGVDEIKRRHSLLIRILTKSKVIVPILFSSLRGKIE